MTTETIDLDGLGLTYGDASQLDGTVELGEIHLGGQDYVATPAATAYRLDVSRTSTGYAMRLRFRVELSGPCFRCLDPAKASVNVDVREVDQPPVVMKRYAVEAEEEEDEQSAAELLSPYVEDGILDIAAWTHDALILSLPAQILCRPDCAGLCPYCGESMNGAEPGQHDHGQDIDPRWSKLKEIS